MTRDAGMAPAIATSIGSVPLANPVMPASGCFGPELASVIPVHRLGAVVTKTIFAGRRGGNRSHRLVETASGMLNSVGIPSLGVEAFKARILPEYLRLGAPVVVSIGGTTIQEYWEVAEQLAGAGHVAVELNVSCPNLEEGGLEIGSDPSAVASVTEGVVRRSGVPAFVKLTPNVADVAGVACAARDAGADALTVSNTLVGMAIDVRTRRPALGNRTGGLSGQAIKPIALRLVHRARQVSDLPVIGCGGIASATDVIEFLLAGACAVQVGTATFTDPRTMITILDALPALLEELDARSVAEMVGAMEGVEA